MSEDGPYARHFEWTPQRNANKVHIQDTCPATSPTSGCEPANFLPRRIFSAGLVAWAIVGQKFHHYQGTARVEADGDGAKFILGDGSAA
jgi:hypothetical protein